MNNIKKIRVSGVDYSVYDEQAHDEINSIDASVPTGLTENSEEKKIYLVNKNGENIGEGVSVLVGADGKSAYQYAVEGGYDGTEEEFVEQMALVASVLAYNGETEDIDPPVEEALLGTWTLNPQDFDLSIVTPVSIQIIREVDVSGVSEDGTIITNYDTIVAREQDGFTIANSSDETGLTFNPPYPTISSFSERTLLSDSYNNQWTTYSTFTINGISSTDTDKLTRLLAFLQANATKQ